MKMENAVETIFRDFKCRRAGLVRALTIDADEFFLQCDPEKDELCLYGLPTKQWEVKVPLDVVPPVLPEPAVGINFPRDLMDTKDWLSLVAIHSDAWLLAVASFYGASITSDKFDRGKLFNKINNLPTVLEVLTDYMKNVQKGKSRVSESRNKLSISKSQGNCSNSGPEAKVQLLEENADKDSDSFCGACGKIYIPGEFWIFCDMCEKWFHGECVKITPAMAERIKLYSCPSCNKKGPRPA